MGAKHSTAAAARCCPLCPTASLLYQSSGLQKGIWRWNNAIWRWRDLEVGSDTDITIFWEATCPTAGVVFLAAGWQRLHILRGDKGDKVPLRGGKVCSHHAIGKGQLRLSSWRNPVRGSTLAWFLEGIRWRSLVLILLYFAFLHLPAQPLYNTDLLTLTSGNPHITFNLLLVSSHHLSLLHHFFLRDQMVKSYSFHCRWTNSSKIMIVILIC